MSALYFMGSVNPWSYGGVPSPLPVTLGSTGWTWDVEFVTSRDEWTCAKASLNTVYNPQGEGFWAFGGVIAYRLNDGSVQFPGASEFGGVANFINEPEVDSVTFGFGVEGDGTLVAGFIFEVWVSPTL